MFRAISSTFIITTPPCVECLKQSSINTKGEKHGPSSCFQIIQGVWFVKTNYL
jgi:hypothetical protein